MSEEEKKVKKPKTKARKIIEWVLTGIFGVLFLILGVGQIDGMVHKNDHHGQMLKFGYGTFVVQTDSMEKDVENKKVYGVKSALITHLDDPEKIYKDYQNGKTIDLTFYYDQLCYNEASASQYNQPQNCPELTNRTSPAQYPIITHRLREMYKNPDENVKKGQGKYIFIVSGINPYSTNLGSNGTDPITINQYQVFNEKYLLGRVAIGSAFLGGVFGFVSSVWGLLILLLIPAFYLIITSVIDIFKAYKEPEEETSSSSKEENKSGSTSSNKGSIELSEEDKKRLKEELLQEMLDKKKGGN